MNALSPHRPHRTTPLHDVYTLAQGGHLARIVPDGRTCQLRITRAGKLILTK